MLRKMTCLIPATALVAFLAGCDTESEGLQTEAKTPETVTIDETDVTAGPGSPAVAPQGQTEENIGPLLTVARTDEFGEYVADQSGRPLYALMGEKEGMQDCTGDCLGAWPPLVATDAQPFSDSPKLKSGMIGTTEWARGDRQVTYNGQPLYYYAEELGPGHEVEATEHDQWGMWHLVSPTGELIATTSGGHAGQQKEAETTAQTNQHPAAPAEDDDS